VITNTITDNGDGGTKSANLTSAFAKVTVNPKVNAQTSVIQTEPQSITVTVGNTGATTTLTVVAIEILTKTIKTYIFRQ